MPAETILSVLNKAVAFFTEKDVDEARRSAELLLAHALGCTRIDLYLRFEQPLRERELETFRGFVRRRLQREPVQYILGRTEFYGLEFRVSPAVLIPRPETEHLVERAIAEARAQTAAGIAPRILDIGTGSGNVALAIRKHVAEGTVTAVDSSLDALAVAEENAAALGMNGAVQFECIDVMTEEIFSLGGGFTLLVSNPPYIALEEMATLQAEVRDHEPHPAATDGGDGLAFYRRIASIAPRLLAPTGTILVEIGFGQASAVADIFQVSGYPVLEIVQDYSRIERVIVATGK